VCLKEADATEVHFCSDCGARLERATPAAWGERASDWSYREASVAESYCVGCGCDIEADRKFCRACEVEIAFVAAPAAPVCSSCGIPWQEAWEACLACGAERGDQVASALLKAGRASQQPAAREARPHRPGGLRRPADQHRPPDRHDTRPRLSSGSPLWSADAAAAAADLPRSSAYRSGHGCLGCGAPVDLEGADYCQACSLLAIADDGFEARHLASDAEAKRRNLLNE
jgi:hypothetical protein